MCHVDGGNLRGVTSLVSVTYLDAIRSAQERALREDPRVFLYGQDIGRFGGAFKATKNLAEKFPGRVMDSPISEDAMVGMAVGAAMEGMRPIVEMQFADFVSTGFNPIVNLLAKSHYRWLEKADVVVRMPCGGGTQAGPFHSQTNEAWFTKTPGLKEIN